MEIRRLYAKIRKKKERQGRRKAADNLLGAEKRGERSLSEHEVGRGKKKEQ